MYGGCTSFILAQGRVPSYSMTARVTYQGTAKDIATTLSPHATSPTFIDYAENDDAKVDSAKLRTFYFNIRESRF